MLTRPLRVAIVVFGGILTGCGKSPPSKPGEEKTDPAATTTPRPAKKPLSGSEADARAVLKAALDSWAFGDTLEKFEQNHPGVQFFDTNRITRKRLAGYELGTVRKDDIGFEFLATLTLRESDRDVTWRGDYSVTPDADGWVINAHTR
jgi:hypothetical protein